MRTNNAGHKQDFLSSGKKSKAKNKIGTTFVKSLFLTQLTPDELRDLHTSKYKKPRNKPNDGCLWKPEKTQ